MNSRLIPTDFLVLVPSWQLLDTKLPSKTQSNESCGCVMNLLALRSTRIRGGIEFIFKLKPPDHEIHQVLPTLKDHIACQRPNIVKKGLPSGKRLAKQRISIITPRQNGMEQKRQQIEAEQEGRQVSLAVTKVMLDMVTLGLEHVVVFVFDLPPATTCSGNLGNVFLAYVMIGDKAVVVKLFPCLPMHLDHLKPIHRQGVRTATQEHIVDIAIQYDVRHATTTLAAFDLLDGTCLLPKRQTLIECGMRFGLARQDEVEAVFESTLTKGLIAVQIVTKQSDPVRGDLPGVLLNPTFASDPLAVLFVVAVLRHDKFRRQGDHLGAPRANNHRRNGRVIVSGLTFCGLTPEAVCAMDVAGGIVLGAIEGHQQLSIQNAKGGQ